MKVLFAVSNESISEAIVKRYPKEYKEILSYKNVYYFNAILKEIQKDKSYDRIVISEDLEPFVNTNAESIDNFIFEHLDKISDEANDEKETSIILICSERRNKGSSILSKLFSIGIYDALLGSERNIGEVCKLINKPRTKKEAKIYYRIDQGLYEPTVENVVNEVEMQNILAYFKRLGKDTDRYTDAFNNVVSQYNEEQLKIIINALPDRIKNVLATESSKYQALMGTSGKAKSTVSTPEVKEPGIKINTIGKSGNVQGKIVIPSNMRKVGSGSQGTVSNNNSGIKTVSQAAPNVVKVQRTENTVVPTADSPVIPNNVKIPESEISTNDLDMVNQDEAIDNVEEKRGRGRPRKYIINPDKPKGKRGRPRKNIEELEIEDNSSNNDMSDLLAGITPKVSEPEPEEYTEAVTVAGLDELDDMFDNEDIVAGLEDDTVLPGMEDDSTLPGMEDDSILPGMEDDDILPGMEDDSTLPGMEDNDILPGIEDDDILPGMEDDSILPGIEDDDILPGMEDDSILPGIEDDDILPGMEDDSILPGMGDDDILPGMGDDDTLPGMEDDDILSGMDSTLNINSNTINNENTQNTMVESIKPQINYSMSNLNSLLTRDKKIVSFVGATKNGTSFLVNNLALFLSLHGINTAILDMTQNRNAYYIYTDNMEDRRQIAQRSIEKLENGYAEGIAANKNLTVYTALPGDSTKYENAEPILSTLVQNHSLVLIDCDFTTPPAYFASCQEIYLVQSMDILTIQPLTAFLRDLKNQGALEPEKVRVVINKELKVRGLDTKIIVGGMARYNDPSMTVMKDLFNKDMVKACTIPFDEKVYSKYLETMATCKVSLNGYSNKFMEKLTVLAGSVYPTLNNKKAYNPMNSADGISSNNNNIFSNNTNNTLNKMKNKF